MVHKQEVRLFQTHMTLNILSCHMSRSAAPPTMSADSSCAAERQPRLSSYMPCSSCAASEDSEWLTWLRAVDCVTDILKQMPGY
jgi:hypothetical protein